MSNIIEVAYERELAELRLQVHQLTLRNELLVADNMARQNERVQLVQRIDSLTWLLNNERNYTDKLGEPE